MIIGVAGNLSFLGYFKYAGFFTENLNNLLSSFHIAGFPVSEIILPVGISFYTFHSVSYLVDVYSGKAPAQKNIFNMALYIILFTQLVAGPIIRYNVFAPQLFGRKINLLKFSQGAERFIIGLGKKVLIANTLARLANDSFLQSPDEMNSYLCWFGALTYTFQIYFDFSGYSDMAIGLSKMLGFDFPENFDTPYRAISIRNFWTRWHISLSSFFRDYLYIPLGGNKKGSARTLINLSIVFLLTGLWHGANNTFIVWGMIHGLFIVLEKIGLEKLLNKIPNFIRSIYVFIVVMFAWIPFRAGSVDYAFRFYKSLFKFNPEANMDVVWSYFSTDFIIAFVLAILLSFISVRKNQTTIKFRESKGIFSEVFFSLRSIVLLAVLFFSAVYLISGTYNPFIYYQF